MMNHQESHVPLRSDMWVVGTDEVALNHRVALRSGTGEEELSGGRPIIGIADTSSDLNPCNLPLADLIPAIEDGIRAAGGIPARFPVMSLGEDLMKPTALLYRNLAAIEVEEMVRSNPLDGLVLLANCDKTTPALLMGAASADVPSITVFGGARPPSMFQGRELATGTDLWHMLDKYRAGTLSASEWGEFERCLSCGNGSCNAMGTASTMAILTETLGMCLPGSSTIPAGHPDAFENARASGERIVNMVREGLRPRDIMTEQAFANARIVLQAIAGSTNAVIHLPAIAGRLGIRWPLTAWAEAQVPVLADVQPSGSNRIQHFHLAGGVPVLLNQLREFLDLETLGVGGVLGTTLDSAATQPRTRAIRTLDNPLLEGPALGVVFGSLAPGGAVIKRSAASPELLVHTGPAVVFHDYADMRARLDDPSLDIAADAVLVLAGCGPVHVPGMPEWGMMPIPQRLLDQGVTDMVRISDGRMSGTSFGTVVLHVAPEAGIGGTLGLVEDGDLIQLNVPEGTLDLLVSDEKLAHRRARWSAGKRAHQRGWPALFQKHVLQAPEGCDLDFLTAPEGRFPERVDPVIGRS
jgi:dihydroxy-acid dehydratase